MLEEIKNLQLYKDSKLRSSYATTVIHVKDMVHDKLLAIYFFHNKHCSGIHAIYIGDSNQITTITTQNNTLTFYDCNKEIFFIHEGYKYYDDYLFLVNHLDTEYTQIC